MMCVVASVSRCCIGLFGLAMLMLNAARADELQFVDADGSMRTLSARITGSGQGFTALERADGFVEIVANGSIVARTPGDDPVPLTPQELSDRLREKFGQDTRIEVQRSFVVMLVLAAPLDKSSEPRAAALVKKAGRFMNNVDNVFLRYARSMRFPLQEPRFPLVLLVFEDDKDFNNYASEATGGRGLSVSSILGFYSSITNWLAVRLSSCQTFEVPLHEAIHQQMYNRVLPRLAPIPKWFDEGIATGFEGSGEKIDVSPQRINIHYAEAMTRLSGQIDWTRIVADDSAFTADVLAGDAYALAWALHWMLATQHKEAYTRFVQELSKGEPLTLAGDDARVERFESTFGVTVPALQQSFDRTFPLQLKRQRITPEAAPPAGRAAQQQALGEYQIDAVRRADFGGQLHIQGQLKNVSPIRAMTFYVRVEADGGQYAEWLVPDLKPGEQKPLPQKIAQQRGGPGGAGTFRVWVRSAPAGGDQAAEWKSGRLPGSAADAP